MNSVAKFISTLFAARTQAHIFHLQTSSYAVHKALNNFYDDIVELADSYAESFQGKHGIIRGYTPIAQFFEDESVIKYFMGLQKFVDDIRPQLPSDSELNNIVDEIMDLINSTVYKLKFLK